MHHRISQLINLSIFLIIFLTAGIASGYDAVDYSKTQYWLSLPVTLEKGVDVFYVYPTAWQKVNATDPDICAIDNASMITGAGLAFNGQATAFSTVANIYAPYYRQINMSVPVDQRATMVAGVPTSDVTAAFDYYINNYNNGRPFILAGHSQGSNVLVNLLSDYMGTHPDVYARMIAAYVIGYSVTSSYLAENPHLKFAEGADDTGVIISYNTQAPDTVTGTNPVVLSGALSINPITWTRDEAQASASQNLGSIMLNRDGSVVLDSDGKFLKVMNYADAQVDIAKGVLVCSTADENRLAPGNASFGRGVYHSFDYPFYYYNIQENAANRVEKYFATH